MLGEGPWLLGARRTLADAYFVGIARWTRYHDVIDRSEYPAVERLFQRLGNDPGIRFAHAIEAGEAARGSGGFRGEVSLDEALGLLPAAA